MKALVTGAAGFIGRHLVAQLQARPDVEEIIELRRDNWTSDLETGLARAGVVFHLAGVNRPEDPAEFARGNTGLTHQLCTAAERLGRRPVIVLASSSQASLENPYGRSKRAAEDLLAEWAVRGSGAAIRFRLNNVFGPGGRPNYNSVVATFCFNLARGQPIAISDRSRLLELVHVGDVTAALVGCVAAARPGACERREAGPVHRIALGDLADRLQSFRDLPTGASLSPATDLLTRHLHATFLSYRDLPATARPPKADTPEASSKSSSSSP